MIAFLQSSLTTAVSFVFVLSLVITIHELGHFLAAKRFGVAIDRFAIGFGRPLARWTDRSGVEWRIGWIPLGGYVKFSGDDNASSVPTGDDLSAMRREVEAREGAEAVARYFHFKPLWQRAIVVAAGPIANFLLAIALFAVLLMTVGETVLPPKVDGVVPGSPAERGGFQRGDLVIEAEGRHIDSFLQLQQLVMLRAGTPMTFVVRRDGGEVTLTATPQRTLVKDGLGGEQKMGQLGLQSLEQAGERVTRRYGPIEAVGRGAHKTWEVLDTTVHYLGRVILGRESADQLGGPLRIAETSGKVAAMAAEGAPNAGAMVLAGLVGLLGLAAVISVGIGFMNLLPVPVLDGGHLLFYAYEAVARRPLTAQVQTAGYRVGLALLLGLMLFATWNDLQQLRVFKLLGGLLS